MKKLLIVLAFTFFGVSSAFSQWAMDITWDDTQCECTTGYFEIIYSIYDNSRQEQIYTNEVISPIALTENDYTEPVPAVQTHCEIGDQEAPSYTIHITVNLVCTGSVTPVIVCTGNLSVPNIECKEFWYSNFSPNLITLNPVN